MNKLWLIFIIDLVLKIIDSEPFNIITTLYFKNKGIISA